MIQLRLTVVPCSVERANAYIEAVHRHHGLSVHGVLAVAVADETGLVRGVAMLGRPVARLLDDGCTLEVCRVATDGCANACSALYGAARRVAKELGYARVITYIRADESGVSLKASGWIFESSTTGRSWNTPSRPRRPDRTEVIDRSRWTVTIGAVRAARWPLFEDKFQPVLFPKPTFPENIVTISDQPVKESKR
jgi:hypothetical protein